MIQTTDPISGFRPFHDPSTKPQWAQLSRLGGDRVAILFKELRASLGKIGGITERLHFAGIEEGWVVRYGVGGAELFTARISPGKLEVKLPWESASAERPFRMPQPSAALRRSIQISQDSNSARICLKNRAAVRSFSSLVLARSKLISKAEM